MTTGFTLDNSLRYALSSTTIPLAALIPSTSPCRILRASKHP
jgi:hypothetical protein